MSDVTNDKDMGHLNRTRRGIRKDPVLGSELAHLPDAERLKIAADLFIEHDMVEEAYDKFDRLRKIKAQTGKARCLTLLGPSRCGKTEICKRYMEEFPPGETEEADIKRILYWECPVHCTPMTMSTAMLTELGDPEAKKGQRADRYDRVVTQLRDQAVELVILDEFHHMVARKSQSIAHDAADWLKLVLNSEVCPIILVGEPPAELVLDYNDQLLERSAGSVDLHPYDIRNPEHEAYLRDLVDHFDTYLPFNRKAGLAEPGNLVRMANAGRGRLGSIAEFLVDTSEAGIEQQLDCISLDLMAQVWKDRAVSRRRGPNPFEGPVPEPADIPMFDISEVTRLRPSQPKARLPKAGRE